jgi:hypothetical protein
MANRLCLPWRGHAQTLMKGKSKMSDVNPTTLAATIQGRADQTANRDALAGERFACAHRLDAQ